MLKYTITMEFCDVCENMLFLRSEEEDASLVKYCKHCSFEKKEQVTTGRAIKVSQTIYSEDDMLYLQCKNTYLRHDPSLPRIRDPSLCCPNPECAGPKNEPQVLYIKYHPVHMKYLYCCDYCGYMWRSNNEK